MKKTKKAVWLVSKIAIIFLATYMATNMPNYINSDVSGFVPSKEVISKNLRNEILIQESQVSSFDIQNDISTGDLNSDIEKNTVEKSEDSGSNEAHSINLGSGMTDKEIIQLATTEAELELIPDLSSNYVSTDTSTTELVRK